MNFEDYVFNTKKTYQFKIGIADELPDNFEDSLETILKKYGLLSFSTQKETPVLLHPLDFPLLKNVNVSYWDIELHYPTYPEALRSYISQSCEIPESKIVVRNPDAPISEYQKNEKEIPYKPILTQEVMDDVSAQHLVGQERVMGLLKELERLSQEGDKYNEK